MEKIKMTTSEITFNVPTTDPAAFSAEWEEWNQTVEESTEPEQPERDLSDIVREHEESMSEDEIEEYERQCLRFDDPFEME
jgi:hypothetical protein